MKQQRLTKPVLGWTKIRFKQFAFGKDTSIILLKTVTVSNLQEIHIFFSSSKNKFIFIFL